MTFFGWLGEFRDPPDRWDLRAAGWDICHGRDGCRADCQHVIICDTRALSPAQRTGLAEADRPAWRLLLLGVEDAAERAGLLTAGCAEALPAAITLHELGARAGRVAEMFGLLPRWRDLGPLTLDLFHRDARKGACWLGLHPREFGLMWRLADSPGETVTRRQLLKDVWRIEHDPETNSVEVHVSRLRAKLAGTGCETLLETDPAGGYRLAAAAPFMFAARASEADALDRYLRAIDWQRETIDGREQGG